MVSSIILAIPSTTTPPVSVCAPPDPPVDFSNANEDAAVKMSSPLPVNGYVIHSCDIGYELYVDDSGESVTEQFYSCKPDGTWTEINYKSCKSG